MLKFLLYAQEMPEQFSFGRFCQYSDNCFTNTHLWGALLLSIRVESSHLPRCSLTASALQLCYAFPTAYPSLDLSPSFRYD